jgi:hypothetical protein
MLLPSTAVDCLMVRRQGRKTDGAGEHDAVARRVMPFEPVSYPGVLDAIVERASSTWQPK